METQAKLTQGFNHCFRMNKGKTQTHIENNSYTAWKKSQIKK